MAERLLSEVTPALLRPGGLQDLAAAALERTLAADPDDAHALWKLAEVHRRRGDFAAARGLYRRLRTRGPDRRKAAWLHRAVGGDGPREAPPGGVWPAPFMWMKSFLAPGNAIACWRWGPHDANASPPRKWEIRQPRAWTPRSA